MNTGYNNIKWKDPRLGRYIPANFDHVEKHPFMLDAVTKPVPVTVGINWYSDFDKPVKDKQGMWWVGKDKNNLGTLRGGHCICMPHNDSDTVNWYKYYDQGSQGACVGYGSSRMMTLLNRTMYQPRWLWDEAKKIDEWEETNPGDNNGTSVKAAMDVLRVQGHKLRGKENIVLDAGISANRWATNVDDLFSVLQNKNYKQRGAIPFHNSWGNSYPRKVWMPCETWQLLMDQQGEFTMVTDK